METLKELEQRLKAKYESFKTDLEVDHAAGMEAPFTVPDQGGESKTAQYVAGLLSDMLQTLTLTSPVDSVVMEGVVNPEEGEVEVSLADSFAIVAKMPPALIGQVKVLVTKGENVAKGQGLMTFTEEALENSAFFVTAMVNVEGQEDEILPVQRVFGPFIPAPMEA